MSNVPLVKVGRVLAEDKDFVTMEIGKRDDVTFHMQLSDSGETVGGDRFVTLVFVQAGEDGVARPWDPFEE